MSECGVEGIHMSFAIVGLLVKNVLCVTEMTVAHSVIAMTGLLTARNIAELGNVAVLCHQSLQELCRSSVFLQKPNFVKHRQNTLRWRCVAVFSRQKKKVAIISLMSWSILIIVGQPHNKYSILKSSMSHPFFICPPCIPYHSHGWKGAADSQGGVLRL